jgi:hypothetical protein
MTCRLGHTAYRRASTKEAPPHGLTMGWGGAPTSLSDASGRTTEEGGGAKRLSLLAP